MSRVIAASLTLKDQNFSTNLKKAGNGMTDFDRQVKSTGNKINSFKQNAMNSFSTMATSIAASLAGVFAVNTIKNFTVDMIESAASSQAAAAQFEQVFGDVGASAQKVVDEMGESFGMVSERLKPAFTTMTSMFKGLGMDTEDAMKQAESAVTIAADAAAFYDKSYEDANAALNSFIKGNYEGGEAIGLFANETQLASWASSNLGLDWKNLDEAGKQVARLKFAEAMQAAAGATGQASRESDSYENQLGNLKSSWETLKAKFGAPILEPAINGLKSLADWISKVDTDKIINGFKTAGENIAVIAVPAFDALKSALSWVVDNKDIIIAATAGIVGGIAAFKIISGISTAIGIFNTLMAAYRAGTLLSTLAAWGFNTALLASPLTWVAVGIGLVIAAGVLLYQNWDTVKTKAGELRTKVKEVFGKIKEWATEKIQPVVDFFKSLSEKFQAFKDAISSFSLPKWINTIGEKLSAAKSLLPSFAVGTNNVQRDMTANIHKGEMIIPARQSENLRKQGITIDNIDKAATSTKVIAVPNSSKGVANINIGTIVAKGITVSEVVDELVPQLQLRLANL